MDNGQVEQYRLGILALVHSFYKNLGLEEAGKVWEDVTITLCDELISLRKQHELDKATITSLKAKITYLEDMGD